jgi:hypothetical protein
MATTALKRGTRIEYSYAGGAIVPGKVVRTYTPKEIAAHAKSHGESAAADLPNWIVCELHDDHGAYRGACHISQIRVTDNRLAA